MPSILMNSATLRASNVVLQDDSPVHIRPLQSNDEHHLIEIFRRCSPRTIYHRFLTALPNLTPAMASYLSAVDQCSRVALIAEADGDPIAVARYEPTDDLDVVELGLIVVDEWQDRGLGRILLRQLFRVAGANGIRRFCAHVLGENRRMLHLLATESRIEDTQIDAGVTTVWFRPDFARSQESSAAD